MSLGSIDSGVDPSSERSGDLLVSGRDPSDCLRASWPLANSGQASQQNAHSKKTRLLMRSLPKDKAATFMRAFVELTVHAALFLSSVVLLTTL
jgi:hypothetical protein